MHKGTWRGHGKSVALGRPEQALLKSYMEGKEPEQHVFSPKTALEERRERDATGKHPRLQKGADNLVFFWKIGQLYVFFLASHSVFIKKTCQHSFFLRLSN